MVEILWGCVIAVVIALILVFLSVGMRLALNMSDGGLDGHCPLPLVLDDRLKCYRNLASAGLVSKKAKKPCF